MIADLKPYAEYKDSGLPWLGQVPSHWSLIPNRGLVRRRKVLVGNRYCEYQLLSLTKQGVIVRDVSTGKGKFSSDLGTSQEVREGDIIFCLFDVPETPRTVGLSRYDGMITGAYTVFESLCKGSLEYFELFYQAMDDRKLLSPLYSGLRNTIPAERFLGIKSPLPPPSEQAAIVRFLDWASGRLERAIRAKRKIVALLNEQKQAIIHRAVTRGLDPSVPLKDSGVPWLGEIPKQWEVSALRRYWKVTDCKHLTVPFVDEGIPLASVVEVQSFSLDLSRCKRTKPDWYRMLIEGDRKPKRDDLIYCRNASVGACALVETDIDFAMGQDVCLIRSLSQNQRFLNYVLHSSFMKHQLELLLVGSTFKRINISEIKTLSIIVPPKLEQDDICEFLDGAVMGYDTAISRLECEIDLLREYRTRLVADVVTGKLDVREVAATLPAEALLDAAPEDDFDSPEAEEPLDHEEDV
jgi:type I restriction enzyme, S subunit